MQKKTWHKANVIKSIIYNNKKWRNNIITQRHEYHLDGLNPTWSAMPEQQQPEAWRPESGAGVLGRRQLASSLVTTKYGERHKLLSRVQGTAPEAKWFSYIFSAQNGFCYISRHFMNSAWGLTFNLGGLKPCLAMSLNGIAHFQF